MKALFVGILMFINCVVFAQYETQILVKTVSNETIQGVSYTYDGVFVMSNINEVDELSIFLITDGVIAPQPIFETGLRKTDYKNVYIIHDVVYGSKPNKQSTYMVVLRKCNKAIYKTQISGYNVAKFINDIVTSE